MASSKEQTNVQDTLQTPTDIVARIEAYDAADGRHCDAAGGDAYELLNEAAVEIKTLRRAIDYAIMRVDGFDRLLFLQQFARGEQLHDFTDWVDFLSCADGPIEPDPFDRDDAKNASSDVFG